MQEIWIMGEILVEIMRTHPDMPLSLPGPFQGPFPSGAPAICADTIARLGHRCAIVGGIGADDFGACVLSRLQKDGVDTSHVLLDHTGSSACAFVTYFSDGSRNFIFHLNNTPAVRAVAPDEAVFKGCRYFHIMGCSLTANHAFGREIIIAMERARRQGAKISFDPNIRPELLHNAESLALVREVLRHTSIFLPGREELLLLTGEHTTPRAVKRCFENPVLEILALKNGAKGCTVYSRSQVLSMGVYPVVSIDATGAGDCFDGAFLCGLLEGRPLSETLKLASAAGALNTAAFGPMEGAISPAALQTLIKLHPDIAVQAQPVQKY